MRLALKVALLRTGRTQRSIAAETHIPEARLSTIVNGWIEPTESERLELQRSLGVGPDAFVADGPTLESRSCRR